jgi:hypothetical protein
MKYKIKNMKMKIRRKKKKNEKKDNLYKFERKKLEN